MGIMVSVKKKNPPTVLKNNEKNPNAWQHHKITMQSAETKPFLPIFSPNRSITNSSEWMGLFVQGDQDPNSPKPLRKQRARNSYLCSAAPNLHVPFPKTTCPAPSLLYQQNVGADAIKDAPKCQGSARGASSHVKTPSKVTYQLFTWSIVSPVSCANCFFCSSEG